MSRVPEPSTQARIVAAARQLFATAGVKSTTMREVAEAAGVSRQTVYETVRSREHLIELAILHRCRELAVGFARIMNEHDDVAEALVEVTAAIVDTCRADSELTELFSAGPMFQAHEVITGSVSGVAELGMDLFRPLLDRGRRRGVLRGDATDAELIAWVRGVAMMLIMRRSEEAAEERDLLRRFLLPSLLDPKQYM